MGRTKYEIPLLSRGDFSEKTSSYNEAYRSLNLATLAWLAMFCSIFIFNAAGMQTSSLGNKDNYYRIILVIYSAATSVFVLMSNATRLKQAVSGPLILLLAYGVYAMITGLFVPDYSLYVMWKGFEVAVDVLVVMALLSSWHTHSNIYTAYQIIVGTLMCLLCVWWVEALIWPIEAFIPTKGIIGFQLQGLLPVYNPNTVGFASALVTVYAISKLTHLNNGRYRTLFRFFVVVGIVTLLTSQSRTNIGGLVIAFLTYSILIKRYKFVIIISLIAIALIFFTFLGEVSREFLERGQTVGSLSTLSGRTIAWEMAWDAFSLSPYLGSGFVGFSRTEILGIHGSSHLHSAFLEVLVGTGLVGVVLWSGGIFWTGIRLFNAHRPSFSDTRYGHKTLSRPEMVAVFVLVMARSITSSGPAMHDHSFMALLVIVAFVSVSKKRGEQQYGVCHHPSNIRQ